MANLIVPTARSIFLCDYHFSAERDKDDLYGICNALRVERFPYKIKQFCVFAQLSNGLGKVPVHLDVRHFNTGILVHVTKHFHLFFKDRVAIVKLVIHLGGFVFPESGLYSFELFCDNMWVGDTLLDVSYSSKGIHP
ncbi:MAG: hypothetical protein QM703_18780 [Gemmatales bacterium]